MTGVWLAMRLRLDRIRFRCTADGTTIFIASTPVPPPLQLMSHVLLSAAIATRACTGSTECVCFVHGGVVWQCDPTAKQRLEPHPGPGFPSSTLPQSTQSHQTPSTSQYAVNHDEVSADAALHREPCLSEATGFQPAEGGPDRWYGGCLPGNHPGCTC